MQPTLTLATISFPEIRLAPRDAHKLRGYFGNLFREHSPLLHNHFEDGRVRYAYPLVQYKVIGGTPTLVGLLEGAKLLTELFFEMKSLEIDGRKYSVLERDIGFKKLEVGVGDNLYDYRFHTLWLSLNQQNYPEYQQKDPEARRAFLGRILTGNMLSFFKGIGLYLPEGARIMATVRPEEPVLTNYKNTRLMGFPGSFTTNAVLPDFVGLGKAVSHGFGTIMRV
ncbi:MAG: DNA repair protein [Saprospirales bacterium]|nr:DNA repair protein [Saprospirales bacterium]